MIEGNYYFSSLIKAPFYPIKQFNNIEKEYILLKFETMLQVELMNLFLNGSYVL